MTQLERLANYGWTLGRCALLLPLLVFIWFTITAGVLLGLDAKDVITRVVRWLES